MNTASTDTWECTIKYVRGRTPPFVGTLRTPRVTFVVTGESEEECADRLLKRYGSEADGAAIW